MESEIRKIALESLAKALGAIGMLCFCYNLKRIEVTTQGKSPMVEQDNYSRYCEGN